MKWIDLPPVWTALFAAVMWSVKQIYSRPMPSEIVFVGWALIAAGLAAIVWSVVTMQRAPTTPIPRQNPTALVTSGPFQWTRNPIYMGDAMILAGLALVWSVPLTLILIPVFISLITKRFIIGEEARLMRVFQNEFADWAAVTPRWVTKAPL